MTDNESVLRRVTSPGGRMLGDPDLMGEPDQVT